MEGLFVALEDAVDSLLGEFLGEQTHDNHHGEAADHGDGTTVDGVDGIANEHVDHCEAYTPNEACPDAGAGNTTPVEAQHKRSQEGTSQSAPRDTHELGNERRRVEGDEQGDGNEEHDEHAHHNHLTTLDSLGHDIIDGTILYLTRQRLLVAIDQVEGHGRT